MAAASQVFSGHFHTQMHGPVGMETRAALAEWDGDNLTVWKTSRAVHAVDRRGLARVLGIPIENVRVICTTMGGGFGAKDEPPRRAHCAAGRRTGRPVRISTAAPKSSSPAAAAETDIEIEIGVAQDSSLPRSTCAP
jgi:CO/xanthine dehydrogenase Mo-binding subunit